MRRLAPLLGVAAALAAGCGSQSGGHQTGAFRGVSQIPPDLVNRPAARIRLRDARGGMLDTANLAGKPYAVTFLYTSCPDVCPLIGSEIHTALGKLGPKAARVAIVAVSVDPHGDTPATVRAWLKLHREPANFHYLIGTTGELKPVWKSWFAAPQIPGDPESSHTAAIWLVDARGRLRANFDAGGPVNPADLAYDFEQLLAGK